MAKKHGIASDSYKRVIIDQGAVYGNYDIVAGTGTLLGATKGGNEFAVKTEYHTIEFDGALGPTKNGRRITKLEVSLKCKFIEMKLALLKMALPGSSSVDYPTAPAAKTHDLVTRACSLTSSDYLTNVAILGEVNAQNIPIIIVLENALCDGEFALNFAPAEDNVSEVMFTAHFDPSTITTEPWKIYYPVIS